MANELDGKVAIVTGASSGIGEATSEALAAESATVVAAARREELLTGLKERVQDNGGRLEVVRADVTDEEAQQGFRPFINSTYSRPRISPPPWPTASPGPRG